LVKIAVRREDKNKWEARVPLIPSHLGKLIRENLVEKVIVQPSTIRAFKDEEYESEGCVIQEKLDAPIVFAVKEIPINLLEPDKTYIFFSHVIKCQEHNMPMLKRLKELKCTLIDYEKVIDEKGRRLIFFGFYAGLSGMINTLSALGKRLQFEGFDTPFLKVKKAHEYPNLDVARAEIGKIGDELREKGLPSELKPLVVGFAGYGNVSSGAQEILSLFPVKEIKPSELLTLQDEDTNTLYKVIFKEEHLVKPVSDDHEFELYDYYDHPEKYESQFSQYVPHLTVLMNCIYWEAKYPRLITKQLLKELHSRDETPKLRIVGDISCDEEGAIEATVQCTDPGQPVFVYNPETGEATLGHEGKGLVIMAVDNLPCETPIESSSFFSNTLMKFMPDILKADFNASTLSELELIDEIKKAIILYKGEFTPGYEYLEKCITDE